MKTLKNNTTETHAAQILEHLQTGKGITAAEAWKRWGCARLGARIYDLRGQGYVIRKETKKVKGRRACAHVAQYFLE